MIIAFEIRDEAEYLLILLDQQKKIAYSNWKKFDTLCLKK